MDRKFKDAVIIITGGASGIGKELARQLLERGAEVIIIDRNESSRAGILSEFQSDSSHITYIIADMADKQQAANAFETILQKHSKIDYVINGAGVFLGGEIRDTPLESWHFITQNNTFAVMNGTYYAYEAMRAQARGHIVNIGSAAGLMPIPAMGIYGSTKYAIGGLTQALRNEAKECNVRVSLVCPTIVDTPLYDTATYHKVNKKRALERRASFQSVDVAAARIIRGIKKNKPVIHTSASTQFISLIYRCSPTLYNLFARIILKKIQGSVSSTIRLFFTLY